MAKSWKVILAFAGVFLAGGICGGLVARRVEKFYRPGGKPPVAQAFWPQVIHRLDEKLSLTPEQKEKIRPIVQRTQAEVQKLRRDHFAGVSHAMERMHAEIDVLLTPEQRIKLEELRSKLRERIERERGEMHGGARPPGLPRN